MNINVALVVTIDMIKEGYPNPQEWKIWHSYNRFTGTVVLAEEWLRGEVKRVGFVSYEVEAVLLFDKGVCDLYTKKQ